MSFSLTCPLPNTNRFLIPKREAEKDMDGIEKMCHSMLMFCNCLNRIKQTHGFILKTGLHNDHCIMGKLLLLSAVTITNALGYAYQLFDHISSPDTFMYNTMIRGLSESEYPEKSLLPYVQMQRQSVLPDSFSFAFALKAAANLNSLKAGIQLHSQTFKHGINTHLFVQTTLVSMYGECGCISSAQQVFDHMTQPNVVTWNAIVTAYFRCGDLKGALELFNQMPCHNLTSWNLMLAGYTKCGEIEYAKNVFLNMPQKDQVSWSTMIVSFAQNGNISEAFAFFRESQRLGSRPNEVCLTGILSSCALVGAFESGKVVHGYIEKAGFNRIVSVCNALIDTYSKCGYIALAHTVFKQMRDKSIVSWTSMIAALAMHGYGQEALNIFHDMRLSGINPDGIAFISILYACSHSGLIEEGRKYFSEMEEIYEIKPSVEHYGCMVDLYGRAGLVKEAYEFVIGMPIEPNDIIWRTLLGACSIHGDVDCGELVKKKLACLDPDNSGDNVLLSNIYARTRKWKDVVTVRKTMSDKKIKKLPGWSMIEVDKVVYSFVADDRTNVVNEKARKKLLEILLRLKTEGYIPEISTVLHDVEEEEKESAVSWHSEKLAIAFGMERLVQESVIRIMKNLRVCTDCHTFMKMVSKIYRREIILRDRSRFHIFQEGFCSCRDYW